VLRDRKATTTIIAVLAVLVVIIAVSIVATLYFRKQLARIEERKLKTRAQLSGLAIPEPEVSMNRFISSVYAAQHSDSLAFLRQI
jgi:uncharacterized membrane protein YciS (DUF1049 family)